MEYSFIASVHHEIVTYISCSHHPPTQSFSDYDLRVNSSTAFDYIIFQKCTQSVPAQC